MPCSASRTASSPLRARAPTPLDERTVLRHRGLLLILLVPDPSAHAEEGGERECEDQCEQAAGHRDQGRSSAGARPLREPCGEGGCAIDDRRWPESFRAVTSRRDRGTGPPYPRAADQPDPHVAAS